MHVTFTVSKLDNLSFDAFENNATIFPSFIVGESTGEMTDGCMDKVLTTRHFKSGANMITFAAMVMKSSSINCSLTRYKFYI